MTIYASHPHGVELSSEGINGCHSHKARLFEWIELLVAVKRIYEKKKKKKKKKVIHMRLKSLRFR